MGSKRRLVPQLLKILPKSGWKTYHEPFLGSGALLYALQPAHACASDKISLLIDLHKAVARNVESVIEEYCELAKDKRNNFFAIRSRHPCITPTEFLFLIKHCHGNRYRTNAQGKFNTPFKENSAVSISENTLARDTKRLRSAASLTVNKDIHFTTCSFEQALSKVNDGDLLFLDPPYQWQICKEYDYGSTFGASEWATLMGELSEVLQRHPNVKVVMTLHGGMKEEEVRSMAKPVPGLVFLRAMSYDGTHLRNGGVHNQYDWLLTNYTTSDL